VHDRNAKAAGRKPENAKDKGKIFKGGVNRFDDSEDDEDGPSKGLHVPGAETAGLINVKDRLAAAKKSTGECFGVAMICWAWLGCRNSDCPSPS
jgi:hypothetical protein